MFKRCTAVDTTHVQAHKELFRLNHGFRTARYLEEAIKVNPHDYDLKYFNGHWLLDNGILYLNN